MRLRRDGSSHLHAVALPGERRRSYGFGAPEVLLVSLQARVAWEKRVVVVVMVCDREVTVDGDESLLV